MSRSTPRVTRMVLFKHGVAYLERSGPASGPFELSFKKDEMNDVLKSLSVWVASGDAKVTAAHFEKPEDPEAALAARRLDFPRAQALAAMLASMRGRRLRLTTETGRFEGEIVGTESCPNTAGEELRQILLRTSPSSIELVNTSTITTLELLEEPSRADIAFVIDRARAATAGDSRAVRVELRGEAADLRVSYVVPAPAWRVSYRVMRAGDATWLAGWGIVHNPADEDLEDIQLALTTGQPVSFVIDLYNPKIAERAQVEEQSRAAAAPTQLERARRAAPPAPAMAAPAPARPQAIAEPEIEYAERGELFEYRVKERVSLGRGGSAMVPLLAAEVRARKERIWRKGSPQRAPDLVLSFKNDSGAVLEEGAAVVYDDGVYAGEAMLPYSARNAEVKIAFAKDLGVRCDAKQQTATILTSVKVGESALVRGLRCEERVEMSAESDHDEVVEVIFELPKIHGRTFDPERPQPFEDTASYWRFKLEVPPHGRATCETVTRWPIEQTVRYEQLTEPELLRWLEDKVIDAHAVMQLRAVLEAWARHRELEAERKRAEKLREDAWAKQQKISEQLAVLKEGGPEGQLRLRYVGELGAAADVVSRCESELARIDAALDEAKLLAETRLRAALRR